MSRIFELVNVHVSFLFQRWNKLKVPKRQAKFARSPRPSRTTFVPRNFPLDWDYTIDTTTSFVLQSCAISGCKYSSPICAREGLLAQTGPIHRLQASYIPGPPVIRLRPSYHGRLVPSLLTCVENKSLNLTSFVCYPTHSCHLYLRYIASNVQGQKNPR